MVLLVKYPPAKSGDVGEHEFNPWVGKITWRRFVPWTIPQKKKLGGLQSMGSQELDMTKPPPPFLF